MLKTLMKKQFMEVNQFFFVNKKTGQLRTAGKRVASLVGWVLVLLMMLGLFFLLAANLGGLLLPPGLTWVYFAFMATLTLVMGVFGTVFNSYSALFHARDNELLLSLPVPVRTILLARLGMTYLLALMYCALVWVPTVLYYALAAPVVEGAVVASGLLMLLVLSLITLVLSCALGWLVAVIATHVKNKSLVTVVVTVALVGVYYYVYFNSMNALQNPETWLSGAESALMGSAWPLYQLGLACCGNLSSLLGVTVLALVLMAGCWLGMSKSFLGIVSGGASRAQVKAEYAADQVKSGSAKQALQRRELKRWISNPTYLMNTGLGVLFMVLMAVAGLWNADVLREIVAEFQAEIPVVGDYVPLLVLLVIMMLAGMDAVCTPSVSLEGKTLWILRSLPVDTRAILDAKMNLQIKVNAVPSVLCALALGYAFGMDAVTVALVAVAAGVYVWFSSAADLLVGLMNPNLNWTSEVVPVKQSGAVMIALFGGWALCLVIGALAFFTVDVLGAAGLMALLAVLFAALTLLVRKWLHSEGVRRFEAL